jgi:outer membrane protein assembly factor BamB
LFNKKSKIAVILVAVLALSMVLQISQIKAQENVPNILYVSVAPNPVGVGQPVYVSCFFTKPLPRGGYSGLEVTVEKDGTTVKHWEGLTTDTTGGYGGLEYTPEEIGEYTAYAYYPGEDYDASVHLNEATSEEVTFIVQEEAIPTYVSPPLPTEYWSRPIISVNYGWGTELAGNWWGLGRPSFMETGGYDVSGNNFNPYSLAPDSSHIMWTKPLSFGGHVGGPIPSDQESHYTSTSILYHQFEPVILNGILFYEQYPNDPNVRPGRIAVDVRTGETLWTQEHTGDSLAFGSVMKFHSIQEYGSQAYLWALDGTTLNVYDPMTGTPVCSVVNVAIAGGMFGGMTGGIIDSNGAVLFHYTSGSNFVMWNSTKCLTSGGAVIVRPGGDIEWDTGIQYTMPIDTAIGSETISPTLSLSKVTHEAVLFQSHGSAGLSTFANEFPSETAIDVAYDTMTGERLWAPKERELIRYNEISVVAAGDGYYVRHDKDLNQVYIYDLLTGDELYTAVQLEGNGLSTLARGAAIAYGRVYVWDFGGYVNAVNLETGEVEWNFTRGTAGYGNPYGVYPIWHFGTHSIADGKLFLSEGRMYNPPLFADARRLAIDCETGELVWSVLGFHARNPGVIADGYFLAYNSYDAQLYTFGKGQTATSITIQDDVVTHGDTILVKGMVTDESPGTKDSDRIARFPNGVPAISDDNQSAWMEYVYMQQPKPTDAIGVEVSITVLDPNGNTPTVATATSDVNGLYSATFVPEVPGDYIVYATFCGSDSYWSSTAVTAITVEETPEATPTPSPTPAPPTDAYVLGLGGASLAAIVAIGIVIILMLRKR